MHTNLYNISKIDLLKAQNKLNKQNLFLENYGFYNSKGKFKTFKEISMSANFSHRYYAEVTNRVNTIYSLAQDEDFKAVFLTITLNGCFRDALKGDFSRFEAKDRKLLPPFIKTKISRNVALEIKDLIYILNYQWNIFSSNFIFKGIKKMYIRSFEPHKKDGVPHIHALLYIPSKILKGALKLFKNTFHAPLNITQNPRKLTKEQINNGEVNGFQWTLNNPSGYVMKYISKTFINFTKTDKIDELGAWYIKHKVRRFLSSRSTIPLWVYRRIFFIEKNFYHLSDMIKDPKSSIEWDFKQKYIRFFNHFRNEELEFINGSFIYKVNNKIIKEYHVLKKLKSFIYDFE